MLRGDVKATRQPMRGDHSDITTHLQSSPQRTHKRTKHISQRSTKDSKIESLVLFLHIMVTHKRKKHASRSSQSSSQLTIFIYSSSFGSVVCWG